MTRRAAGPISIKRPKLVVLLLTASMVEVPVLVISPLAKGLLVVGRTRRFCQVIELVTEPLLALVIVRVIWLVVREVMATAVPLATLSIFLVSFPPPPVRVTTTVG